MHEPMITWVSSPHEGQCRPARWTSVPRSRTLATIPFLEQLVTLSRYAALAALGALGACASASSSGTITPGTESSQSSAALGPHGDSRLITAADLATATQSTLYDYLMAVRPRWFTVTSVGIQSRQAYTITVFIGDTKLGEPETLRSIAVAGVKAVRYYDASASQQKFPGRGLGPVIQVIRD